MTEAPKLTNAQRAANRRAKDREKDIVQINIRIPRMWDVALKLLAERMRKGQRLEGFVLRNQKTGRVETFTI